jgi:hypothetical protein
MIPQARRNSHFVGEHSKRKLVAPRQLLDASIIEDTSLRRLGSLFKCQLQAWSALAAKKSATSASMAWARSVRAPLRNTSVSGSAGRRETGDQWAIGLILDDLSWVKFEAGGMRGQLGVRSGRHAPFAQAFGVAHFNNDLRRKSGSSASSPKTPSAALIDATSSYALLSLAFVNSDCASEFFALRL